MAGLLKSSFLLMSLLPLAAAQSDSAQSDSAQSDSAQAQPIQVQATQSTQAQETLSTFLPDVSALKRMCTSVKSMTSSDGASGSEKNGEKAAEEVNQWLEQAKPVCEKVDKMSEDEMATFLKSLQEKQAKASEEQLKQKCEAIQQASKNDKLEWYEQQALYKQLKGLCDKIKEHPEKLPEIVKELQGQTQQNVSSVIKDLGNVGNITMGEFMSPEALERGCKIIDEAKNNKKIDWFEQAPWYSKAKGLCDDLKKVAANATVHTPEADMTKEVKSICAELKKEMIKTMLAKNDESVVQKANQVCKDIDGKSDEDIKKYLAEHGTTLKSLGLEKLTEACGKITSLPALLKSQEWYKSLSEMCKKVNMTSQAANAGGIAQQLKERCTTWASGNYSKADLEKEIEKNPAMTGVVAACAFMKNQDMPAGVENKWMTTDKRRLRAGVSFDHKAGFEEFLAWV